MGILDDYISALQKVPMSEGIPFGAGTTPEGDPTALSSAITSTLNLPKKAIDASAQDIAEGNLGHANAPLHTAGPAFEVARQLAGMGMPAAEANAAGIFGGKLAAGANLGKLETAKDMLQQGYLPAPIRSETGWFRTPSDRQWKFEIPDQNSRMMGHGLDYSQEGNFVMGPAQAMMQHPEFFEHYPQLKDNLLYNTVYKNPKNGIGKGQYNPEGIMEIEAPDLGRANQVALHEMQHGVQDIEGFQPGSNPSTMAWYQQWAKSKLPLSEADKKPLDLYNRMAGEVEARNVMNRALLSPEQAAQQHPWQTQDVPFMDQLRVLNPKADIPIIQALRDTRRKP